jgi:hypothetical protein
MNLTANAPGPKLKSLPIQPVAKLIRWKQWITEEAKRQQLSVPALYKWVARNKTSWPPRIATNSRVILIDQNCRLKKPQENLRSMAVQVLAAQEGVSKEAIYNRIARNRLCLVRF